MEYNYIKKRALPDASDEAEASIQSSNIIMRMPSLVKTFLQLSYTLYN